MNSIVTARLTRDQSKDDWCHFFLTTLSSRWTSEFMFTGKLFWWFSLPAYCRNSVDGQWYNYDDSSVDLVPEEEVCTRGAYILFYQRRNIIPPWSAHCSVRGMTKLNDWIVESGMDYKVPTKNVSIKVHSVGYTKGFQTQLLCLLWFTINSSQNAQFSYSPWNIRELQWWELSDMLFSPLLF